MHLPSSPSACGLFSNHRAASTQRTKYRWMPGQRDQFCFYMCSVPPCFPQSPLHLHSSNPEPSAVPTQLQLQGNIFAFLSSFSWLYYIRVILAAWGKEVGAAREELQVRDPDSILISTLLVKPHHNPLSSGQWQTVPRRAKTQVLEMKNQGWNWSDLLKVTLKVAYLVKAEVRAQISLNSCLFEEDGCEFLSPGRQFFLSFVWEG